MVASEMLLGCLEAEVDKPPPGAVMLWCSVLGRMRQPPVEMGGRNAGAVNSLVGFIGFIIISMQVDRPISWQGLITMDPGEMRILINHPPILVHLTII